jgi:hypothetical protein
VDGDAARRHGIADEAPDARPIELDLDLDARTAETLDLAASRHDTTPEAITRAALHLRALEAARVTRKQKRAALSRGETEPVFLAIRVSAYHLEGMSLAARASATGGNSADGWAARTLAGGRLPIPTRRCSYPDQPTGHVVTLAIPRGFVDRLDAIAARDGRPLRQWIHAVLVAASAKYRATLDRQAADRPRPDIEPAPCRSLPENVLPFFTGHFRQA